MRYRIEFIFIVLLFFSSLTYPQFADETVKWFTFGSGLSSTSSAVAVLGNDVYVGGQFVLTGGILVHNVAKWDGSSWSALGTGVNGFIKAIAVIGSDIYVAGFFSEAGGIAANNIAKWDGNN